MSIFDDFLNNGTLFKLLQKEGLIRNPFEKKLIESLYEYGWYEELYDNKDLDFEELEKLPFYVVLIDENKKDAIQKLVNEYSQLVKVQDTGHFFDFLVINAELKIMCGIGLGRKNKFFSLTSQNGSDFYDDIDEKKEELLNSSMPWKFLTEIKFTLKNLGLEFFERDHLPSNIDILQETLKNGPNDNDLFSLEYDDEEYTEEEIKSYIQEHEARNENIDYFGMLLKEILPTLEIHELNTGDY